MNSIMKTAGFIFMIILLGGIFYLSIELDDVNKYGVEFIDITGAKYLTNARYFKFANLNDKSKYPDLTLTIIKDRLEKHPYIKYAEVYYAGGGKVKVRLYEKSFVCLLFADDKNFLLTNNFAAVPVLPFTKHIDFPVIGNPDLKSRISELKRVDNNNDIKLSYKIIEALKYISPKLQADLSEIDLRRGKDIVLYFSDFDYPVVLGRKNEIRKLVYFSKIWKDVYDKGLNSAMEYVDLRYDKKIFIGLAG